MSSSYTVVQGDTFEMVARKVYGDDRQASLVASANPGTTSSTLVVGSTLVIPAQQRTVAADVTASNEDTELSLRISGRVFRFWTSVSLFRAMDSVSTAEVFAPFEPDEQAFRNAFRPFTFQDVTVGVGGVPLFTGTMLSPRPSSAVNKRDVRAPCYSTPGVLMDCTPPASSYPLEWDLATLQTVAGDLCRPFGVSVSFPNGPGPVFERVSTSPGERVMQLLRRLASQRNLVITSNAAGDLVFYRPLTTGEPVVTLTEGTSPVVEVSATFNDQRYYTHITGIAPTIVGLAGPQATVKNQSLTDAVRPFTYEAEDMEVGDLREAVRSKAGRMFAGAISYTVDLDTWRDPAGDLWQPGTFVRLDAPGVMVYESTLMQIRDVHLEKTSTRETAALTLILPGSLSGQLPEVLPWQDSQ